MAPGTAPSEPPQAPNRLLFAPSLQYYYTADGVQGGAPKTGTLAANRANALLLEKALTSPDPVWAGEVADAASASQQPYDSTALEDALSTLQQVDKDAASALRERVSHMYSELPSSPSEKALAMKAAFCPSPAPARAPKNKPGTAREKSAANARVPVGAAAMTGRGRAERRAGGEGNGKGRAHAPPPKGPTAAGPGNGLQARKLEMEARTASRLERRQLAREQHTNRDVAASAPAPAAPPHPEKKKHPAKRGGKAKAGKKVAKPTASSSGATKPPGMASTRVTNRGGEPSALTSIEEEEEEGDEGGDNDDADASTTQPLATDDVHGHGYVHGEADADASVRGRQLAAELTPSASRAPSPAPVRREGAPRTAAAASTDAGAAPVSRGEAMRAAPGLREEHSAAEAAAAFEAAATAIEAAATAIEAAATASDIEVAADEAATDEPSDADVAASASAMAAHGVTTTPGLELADVADATDEAVEASTPHGVGGGGLQQGQVPTDVTDAQAGTQGGTLAFSPPLRSLLKKQSASHRSHRSSAGGSEGRSSRKSSRVSFSQPLSSNKPLSSVYSQHPLSKLSRTTSFNMSCNVSRDISSRHEGQHTPEKYSAARGAPNQGAAAASGWADGAATGNVTDASRSRRASTTLSSGTEQSHSSGVSSNHRLVQRAILTLRNANADARGGTTDAMLLSASLGGNAVVGRRGSPPGGGPQVPLLGIRGPPIVGLGTRGRQ